MTCSFSQIGSISPSRLHWSFLYLLRSGNPDWQNFDLKISFTMWFSHVIHMTKALSKKIDLPHATVAENWDFIHPGIGTVPSGMFHYQAELITTSQVFFFLDSANIKKNIWSSVSFSNPPKVPIKSELRTQNLRVENHTSDISFFFEVFLKFDHNYKTRELPWLSSHLVDLRSRYVRCDPQGRIRGKMLTPQVKSTYLGGGGWTTTLWKIWVQLATFSKKKWTA